MKTTFFAKTRPKEIKKILIKTTLRAKAILQLGPRAAVGSC